MSEYKSTLSAEQLDAFGKEIDAVGDAVYADLGEQDVNYIKKVIRVQQGLEIFGRVGLYAGIFYPVIWIFSVIALGVSKILENMEIGHNVMHCQYDWTNDPKLQGASYEWDNVCPSRSWMQTHNFVHHTYTNIEGLDKDLGYDGAFRIHENEEWQDDHKHAFIVLFFMMTLFQYGVAYHEVGIDEVRSGERSREEAKKIAKPITAKVKKMWLKEYLLLPLLAGPYFWVILLGNILANLIRNVWAFLIIFCGHFTEETETFPQSVLENESRGHWFYRQILGSSNISGSKLMHIMSGNLSHQIEHHLFPDMPASRYSTIAPEIKAICDKYGVAYNTGTFGNQLKSVYRRIAKFNKEPQAIA